MHSRPRAGSSTKEQWPSDTMVATGRKARSAKNRLSLSRVAVPVSLTGLQLPPGCAVSAKDIDELVHGESALQQLCALGFAEAAAGRAATARSAGHGGAC